MDKEGIIYIHTYTYTHIHTTEYYSATEKNETLPIAVTWMNLEGIMVK